MDQPGRGNFEIDPLFGSGETAARTIAGIAYDNIWQLFSSATQNAEAGHARGIPCELKGEGAVAGAIAGHEEVVAEHHKGRVMHVMEAPGCEDEGASRAVDFLSDLAGNVAAHI